VSSTVSSNAPADERPALVRAGAVVAVGSAVANVIAFALTIVIARVLTRSDFGASVALLGVAVVGQVPAMALQAVVARAVAVAAPADRAALVRPLLRQSALVAAVIAALTAALAAPAAKLLHLGSAGPVLWLAASLGPITVVFAIQGLLQGAERFTGLAVLLIVVAATRVSGGVAGAYAGTTGVFLGVAVAAVGALAFALWLVRAELRAAGNPAGAVGLYGELWPAIAGMGALLALTNVDVMLARHFLSGPESGLYAAGTVASKIAFWFPQAVAMVVFPRLAQDSDRHGLLGRAVAVMLGLGAATSVGCAVLGPWLFGLLLGHEYTSLGARLGLFAAAGAAGTLVQLALYSGIAARDRLVMGMLVVALAVLIALVSTVAHSSVLAINLTVLGTLAALAAAGLALSGWRMRATRRA
jgi:O-antigen/teichoic acid export membrane protein